MHGAISFEVKAVDSANPDGEFEAILSMPTLDRDGEVIDARAFEPLPETIPVHKFHDFNSPVAIARPYYDGDVLKASGTFDPDPDAQTIRAKVGRSIGYMSVGFMDAKRSDVDGVPHITKAELLEASFVSVPSNRQAAILAAKAYEAEAKLGARNSVTDLANLQSIHDLSVATGAACEGKTVTTEVATTKSPATDPEAAAGSEPAAPPADVNVGTLAPRPMRVKAELLLLG